MYIVGESYRSGGELIANYLAKYSSEGDLKWVRDIPSYGRDVKVDSSGSVVVLTDYSAHLIKYSDDKSEQWSIPLNVGNYEGEIAIGSDDHICCRTNLRPSF